MKTILFSKNFWAALWRDHLPPPLLHAPIVLLVIALSSGCRTHLSATRDPGFLMIKRENRRDGRLSVDFREAPQMQVESAQVSQIVTKVYPQIATLLKGDTPRLPDLKVVFKSKLELHDTVTPGYTRIASIFNSDTIYLNADWLAAAPTSFDPLLVHELTHVIQHYEKSRTPSYWTEGIADYVCFKLGHTNQYYKPECSSDYPYFKSGYRCAGAFLLYLDARYGASIIRTLHKNLQRGNYSEELFLEMTGKRLDQLWTDFQSTGFCTADGAIVYELQKSLGYIEGNKDILQRNELPGFSKRVQGDRKEFSLGIEQLDMAKESVSNDYPAIRTFYGQERGDPCKYRYRVRKESSEAPWRLDRSWRTAPGGRLLEEYAIP
jgi:hypothetical protein